MAKSVRGEGLLQMNINQQFKQKFNELDQLCKRMYPKYPKGFDAMRQFAYSLEGENKNTLLNIIKTRNVNTHDSVNVISFNKAAVDFLQGLIDGANRKYYNGSKNKIDSNIENLRTKNLKVMGSKVNWVIKRYSFLNTNSLNDIRSELNRLIQLERTASGLENVKKYYFDFLTTVKMIENRSDVRNARRKKKESNLNSARNRARNEIEDLYAEVINNTSFLNLIIRNKAKLLKKSALDSIERCNDFYNLDEIVDQYQDLFDDLLND